MNSSGQHVTHLLQLSVDVATGGGGNEDYVDIVGFAVMRVASMDSNTISGLRNHASHRRHERSPAAPRSGGAAGALELAGRARHTDNPGGA